MKVTFESISMKNSYYISVWSILAASLIILWAIRFPPMQDYPAHLMISKVVATAGERHYDWDKHFIVEQTYGPYSLSYNLTALLGKVISIEHAGKAVISIYFILTALFVLDMSKVQLIRGHIPWPMLLIFPLLYNQIYYLGFLNYLISIPIIAWLIYDYHQIGNLERHRYRTWAQLIAPIILFLLHPFSLVLYCGLTIGLLVQKKISEAIITSEHLAPLIWLLIFTLWFATENIGNNRSATPFTDLFYYWSIENNLHFLLLPITGNHAIWASGIVLGAWGIIAYILLRSEYSHGAIRFGAAFIILLLVGYLILPFNFLGYSYLSQRLAPLLYIALTVYISSKAISPKHLPFLMISILVIYYDVYKTHSGISSEIEQELVPTIARIPENSSIYAIYLNGESEYIDHKHYYQFHAHTHNYYHTLIGGGYSPGLIYNDMLPVKYKNINATDSSKFITLTECGVNDDLYDYVMIRGVMNIRMLDSIPEKWKRISTYGNWSLYKPNLCADRL